MSHVHACPRCYEHVPCDMACSIEPDLGTTHGGLPFGHHDVCAECVKAALSQAEVALAKMLAAWSEWPYRDEDAGVHVAAVVDVGDVMVEHGFAMANGSVTDAGRDLLDRARKAGVL